MRSDRERLLDLLEPIDRIQRYARRGRRTFENEELIQTWVTHHLEIPGRRPGASPRIFGPAILRSPGPEMAALRNVLVHDYFEIDVERVWNTVERDLPAVRTHLQSILSGLDA